MLCVVLSVVLSAALGMVYGSLRSTVVLGCDVVWQLKVNANDGARIAEQPACFTLHCSLNARHAWRVVDLPVYARSVAD